VADLNLMDQAFTNPDLANIESLLSGEPETKEIVEEPGEPISAEVVVEEPKSAVEEEAPQSIATKSGKGQIPYTVLQTERERRQAAEQAMQQMQQRLDEATRGTNTPSQPTEVAETTDDELAEISNDFPQIGKVIKQLQAKLQDTQTQLQKVRQTEESRAEVEQSQAQKSVQEAMDENPKLLHWQANDPDLFEQAVQIDQSLQTNPRFSHLSLTERFAKVVVAMEAIHGSDEKPTEPEVSTEKLVELAKEAATKAEKGGKPRTLSDLPGGLAPQSDDAKLENMSTTELAGMLASKSPEEIAAFLGRFG
jgi:hypothetical protein